MSIEIHDNKIETTGMHTVRPVDEGACKIGNTVFILYSEIEDLKAALDAAKAAWEGIEVN